MKLFSLSLLIVLISSCANNNVALPEPNQPPLPKPTAPVVVSIPEAPTPSAAPTPASPVIVKPAVSPVQPQPSVPVRSAPIATSGTHPLTYQEINNGGVTFYLTSFNSSQYYLAVADQPTLGGKWSSARRASESLGGVAAINGGFFSESGNPLGLVKSQGKRSGAWNTSSSLASGVYQYTQGKSSLRRNRNANQNASELLQTGPFLVENGAVVSGLSKKRIAQRSILLWDGKNHFAFGITSACTLSELALAIKTLPSSLPRKNALNLDGGRSTDFYVSPQVKNGNISKGHWLKSQVRNYLVLQKK